MNQLTKTADTHGQLFALSRWSAGRILFWVIALLVSLRGASEWYMMSEFGTDPQMPIWFGFLIVKLGLWLLGGWVAAALLLALWRSRWGSVAGLVLLLVWAVMACAASWQYLRARQALAVASAPLTSSDRLQELVSFNGIQAGYELDNRIASHPNTPPEALRELYQRGQLGTAMVLASNPNTPEDILQELVEHDELWVQRCLLRNPKLPASVRQKLQRHRDKEIKKLSSNGKP